MLKIVIGAAIGCLWVGAAAAQYGNSYGSSSGGSYGGQRDHTVRGYTNNSGSYVQPHHQTNPNNSQLDNYSTRGNVNPYTGQPGTRNPF